MSDTDDTGLPIVRADYDVLMRRLRDLETELRTVKDVALRADQRSSAHQPFVDQVRGLAVEKHTWAQELSDAVLALRQMSSALEDLVRRGTK